MEYFLPTISVSLFLICTHVFVQERCSTSVFSCRREADLSLQLPLGEGGGGAGFPCYKPADSRRGEIALSCALAAVSDSCWVGAILANHKINRLMFRDYSFMPSHRIPHKYSYLCPNIWQLHTSVFTILLTPGPGALFW